MEEARIQGRNKADERRKKYKDAELKKKKDDEDAKDDFAKVGADNSLSKPCGLTELKFIIEAYLKKQKGLNKIE